MQTMKSKKPMILSVNVASGDCCKADIMKVFYQIVLLSNLKIRLPLEFDEET